MAISYIFLSVYKYILIFLKNSSKNHKENLKEIEVLKAQRFDHKKNWYIKLNLV